MLTDETSLSDQIIYFNVLHKKTRTIEKRGNHENSLSWTTTGNGERQKKEQI
jgi:hypothetical protein